MPRLFYFTLFIGLTSFALAENADSVLTSASLPAATQSEIDAFDFARDKSLGLIVSDPLNGYITLAKAKHVTGEGGPWTPVDGTKKMACGTFSQYAVENGFGNGDEYDWNINIIPTADFQGIIQGAKRATDSNCNWKKYFIINGQYTPLQCPNYPLSMPSLYRVKDRNYTVQDLKNFKNVEFFEAEITPDEKLYQNEWFPEDGSTRQSKLLGKMIGVYGPWVLDGTHGNRPEIHPCEVIWWRNSSAGADTLFIAGIQDDSNRFDESSDFFGTSAPMTNEWAKPPMKSIYKIPFEYDGKFTDHLVVNIEELRARNVVTKDIPGFGDTDDGNQHILRLADNVSANAGVQSKILAEVNEMQSDGRKVGVSFTNVARKPNGNIIGYITLKSAYGLSAGEEGYQILKLTIKHPTRLAPNSLHH